MSASELLLIVPTVVCFAIAGCSKEVKVEWSCQWTTSNSMQCNFKNIGQANAEACFDLVHVCKKGDHVAKVCSGSIQAGGTESKVVPSFTPPIGTLETCMGTEFRNKQVLER